MYLLYLIALIPIAIGLSLWMLDKRIVLWEWAVNAAIAFALSGLAHLIIVAGMTADVEILSGKIVSTTFYPEWIEEYQEMHTSTDEDGNTTIYYTTEHRTHYKEWMCDMNFGSITREENITEKFYHQIKNNFGNKIDKQKPYKSGFDSGDPYIYVVQNHTGYVYPVTTTKHFENRIKAAPSTFSFVSVGEKVNVYEYPACPNNHQSNRLVGKSVEKIDILEFDRMCSRLGPIKKVNVILVGFDKSSGIDSGHLQEAKWIGGKKNDLVICYGEGDSVSRWSYVFGWTEKENVKRNLETIILGNKMCNEILPKIEEEIRKNYVIKDWTKFDYITIEPPMYSYFILIALMVIVQVILWYAFMNNGENKS